ncbi:FAD binding domain-containing protein [Coprinopsis marcescibilis]|uniref:FAD binding domain-containing protein n=1 Tax=Coprinopsis marcescibilis TaxID=230819 RepID=A0A5C3L7K7_COPMA|nr:FAD binding domain-containing protein [Coprinopsis marcescibilis]
MAANSFQSFIQRITGDVITPEHSSYIASIARWATNAQRTAKAVVYAKNTNDIVAAIAFAKENKLLFAICGGGHNASGASSAEDGIVVDLSRYLNGVRINAEERLGYAGGGALWRNVDEEAIKYGLAAVGGTVNHGLTVGGGYGWLSGQYGLALDNLQQATVVTADGSVRTASENENSDLFWAIRGGGSNFGVVAEFVFRLHPQRRKIFAGTALYPLDKVEALIETTKRWWPNIKEHEGMFQAAFSDPEGNTFMQAVFFYNGSEDEGRKNFKAFFDIGPLTDTTNEIPYEEMNAIQNHILDHGKGYYVKGFAQKEPDYAIAKAGEFSLTCLYEYFPLEKINSVPVASTAFRRMASQNILGMDKSQKARELMNEVFNTIISPAQLVPEQDKVGYVNYVATGAERQLERAHQSFGPNLPRLREVKKK